MSNFAFEPVSLPASRVRFIFFFFGSPEVYDLGELGHDVCGLES